MADMTPEDEAFIQRFVGLNTVDKGDKPVKVPSAAATSTDWSMAVLVRIVTDRTVMDNPFSVAMSTAWNADPNTLFRPVSRNCYLVECTNMGDVDKVLLGGPWTFRGDLVAARKVSSHSDLRIESIEHGQVWIQLFNVPVNSINEEGVRVLTRDVGVPLSLSVHGFANGRRFIKQKVQVRLDKPLKDTLSMDHPYLGVLTVHCHYEKVARICVFCGRMGHEMVGCADHARLTMLLHRPDQVGKYNVGQLLSPKFGPWLTNVGRIPKPDGYSASAKNKRSLGDSGSEEGETTQSFFVGQMVNELPPSASYSLHLTSDGGIPKRPRSAGRDSPAPGL